MGDSIGNGQRRVIRVYVEPVEVELDEDNTLLFSALQSAIPGASGLYFMSECKSSVKFDGKKLIPPVGGWKDRKYFASLGCRSDFPFGSYANASKQFERSVNAVQRLFGKCNAFDYGPLEREMISKKPIALSGSAKETNENRTENMKQILSSISQLQSNSPTSTSLDEQQKITPLEQQFVDLARISTAKDTIIEQQRSDIKKISDKLEIKNKELKEALDDLSNSEKRCNAKEEELVILRGLSKEQIYMCEKVNEQTKRLLEADETIAQQKSQIDDLLKRLLESEQQNKSSTERIAQLTLEMESAQTTIQNLDSYVEKMKPLAALRQITEEEQILSYVQMSESLEVLKERNEKLENDMKEMEEKYKQLNEIYTEVVEENTKALLKRSNDDGGGNRIVEEKLQSIENQTNDAIDTSDWQKEREALKNELKASENKIAELTRTVHTLTNEAAKNEHRATEAIATRNEMKRSLEHMETKIQITISK